MAATLPSGAISASVPSIGFSVTAMTRNGAPFHGANGDGNTVSALSSAQPAAVAFAAGSMIVNSNSAVASVANRRARSISTTFLERRMAGIEWQDIELPGISQPI